MNTLLVAPTIEKRAALLAEKFPNSQVFFDDEFASADDARNFKNHIVLNPQFGTPVFYMGADRWNPTAQNILLKLCEESPADTTIIIGASSSGDIVPTLRSRLVIITTDDHNTAPAQKITIDNCDAIPLIDVIEQVRISIAKNPDLHRIQRFEKALTLLESKKLSEKQIKETLLLL